MVGIGDRIRELREKNGMISKDLAKELDINVSTYSKLENEKKSIDVDELRKISKYFNVTSDFILGINNQPDIVLYMKRDKNLLENDIIEINYVINLMDEALSQRKMRK